MISYYAYMNTYKNTLRFFIFPFIGGLLYATGFPTGIVPLNFLGPIFGLSLLFNALPKNIDESNSLSFKTKFAPSLIFCLAANLLSYYWIPKTIGVFGNIPFPFNFILGLFFTLIVLPHLLIFNVLYFQLIKFKNKFIKDDLIFYFLASIILCILESTIPQQFPAHAGHSWIILAPYIGLAKVFGAPAFSLINIFLAFTIAHMFQNKKIEWHPIAFFFTFLMINIFLPLTIGKDDIKIDHLRIVQADIGSLMKVDSESGKTYATKEVIEAYSELSLKKSEKKIDLIIWPETAYPNMLQEKVLKTSPYLLPADIKSIIQKSGTELLFGGYDFSVTDYNSDFFESQYNAVFHISNDLKLKNVYRKMKLIPFGESLPFGRFNKTLAKYIQNISYFASGKKYPVFHTQNDSSFFVAICYEILFSNFIKNYLNNMKEEPRFMVNITNDSWYGDTSEPEQHLHLARWRALEFNIPIVRSTNTGITSILYPDGSQSQRLKVGEKSVLDIDLETSKRTPTIYQEMGYLSSIIFGIFLLGLLKLLRVKPFF